MATRVQRAATAPEEAGQAEPGRISSPDLVVESITRGLVAGRYVPGQKLVEPDLMREHKVSRSSVREALRRLSAEGLVTLTLHRGAYVRALTRGEVDDLLDIVELLTGLAARKAALAVRGGAPAQPVQDALQRLSAVNRAGDALSIIQARNDFHRAVVRLSGSHELERLLKVLNLHLLRVQFRTLLSRSDVKALDDYERMASAIVAGSADEAERAGRRHVGTALRVFRDLPDEAFAAQGSSEDDRGAR